MDWLANLFRVDECGAAQVTAVATCLYVGIAFTTLFAVLSVGLGQLRQLRKDAHKQLIVRMLENWRSQDMTDSRVAVARILKKARGADASVAEEEQTQKEAAVLEEELLRLRKEGDKEYWEIVRISDYMEIVGYMMKSNADRKTIMDLYGDAVINYYQYFQRWIEDERKEYPRLYEYFTELYEFCKKHVQTTT